MGASCHRVLPSMTSSTGHSVDNFQISPFSLCGCGVMKRDKQIILQASSEFNVYQRCQGETPKGDKMAKDHLNSI